MDHIDKKILEELQKNSSIPTSELSKKIGITTTPCWNRIKNLEEDKVITSKTITLDSNKINLGTTVFLSISIQNHREKWLKNFEKIINKYDEIIEVHRIAGNTDYQLTILMPTVLEYDAFQQKLIKEIECTNLSTRISMNTIKKTNKLSLKYIKLKQTKIVN